MKVIKSYNSGSTVRLRFDVGSGKTLDDIVKELTSFKSEEYKEGFDGACFSLNDLEYDFVLKSWGEIDYMDRMKRDDFKLVISDVQNDISFYLEKVKEKLCS